MKRTIEMAHWHKSHTLEDRPRGCAVRATATSSYSAASSSRRWWESKNLGRIYCLMPMRMKNGKGKRIPAIGIHVTPKHNMKYANWKRVNMVIDLNGTMSTNEAWTPSFTLSTMAMEKSISGRSKKYPQMINRGRAAYL